MRAGADDAAGDDTFKQDITGARWRLVGLVQGILVTQQRARDVQLKQDHCTGAGQSL